MGGKSSTARGANANELVTSATFPVLITTDEPQIQKCLKIDAVELNLAQNAESHHSDRYEIASKSLVIRRGSPFCLALRSSRDFDPDVDTIKIVTDFGPTPNVTKGTRNILPLDIARTSAQSQPGRWDGIISSYEGSNINVMIEPPVTCQIGSWHCTIVTGLKKQPQLVLEKNIEEHFYILFNPMNGDDATYMSDENERFEYVLNDTGKVWTGSYEEPEGLQWVFGQFKDAVLRCVMHLLDLSELPHEDRGNPVLIARAVSATVNSNDEGGLVIGRWGDDYRDGTAPWVWTGSVAIMEEYLKSGAQPVPYAQCWVFSGLTVTACRALGLPCRSVTNYVSAHDTNSSLTVDKFFNGNGEEIVGGPHGTFHDSVWNFHVWNEVWMTRPDLPAGYGGWQIIDSTPQELSGNMRRCGPASMQAVKNGRVDFLYDTTFVYSEVNADICYFIEDQQSYCGLSSTKTKQDYVGKKIVTKMVGVDEDTNDSDVWDITASYKDDEKSIEERLTFYNALGVLGKTKYYFNINEVVNDVALDLIKIEAVEFGQPFSVMINIQNKSPQERTIDAVLSADSVSHTGITTHRLKKSVERCILQPHGEKVIRLDVSLQEYESKLVEQSLGKIRAMAAVLETKQTWSEEDDFPLTKTQLDIQVDGAIQVGQPCTARFAFVNPLDRPLTNCSISVEGPGLQGPKTVRCQDVGPRDEFSYTESFHPRRSGEGKFLATFSSNELSDVSGSMEVAVAPSHCVMCFFLLGLPLYSLFERCLGCNGSGF